MVLTTLTAILGSLSTLSVGAAQVVNSSLTVKGNLLVSTGTATLKHITFPDTTPATNAAVISTNSSGDLGYGITQILAGAGLTGGGTFAADRTLNIGAGTGLTVNADDVQLSTIADALLMANISAAAAVPSANTLTAILDYILGSTSGRFPQRVGSWLMSSYALPTSIGTTAYPLISNGTNAVFGQLDLTAGVTGTLPAANLPNAAADGATKGISWFTAADFNDNGSGGISLDYTNGQKATASVPGFLNTTDWSIFNNKEPAITASTTAKYWRGDKTFQTLDTSVVPENGSIYYTDERVDDRVGALLTAGTNVTLNYDDAGNALTITAAGGQVLDGRASCRLATTANLSATYSNGSSGVGATLTYLDLGVDSIDGSSLALNDRILVKNQTLPRQNGIYTATTLGTALIFGVLTRATDYDAASNSEVVEGSYTLIDEGTANADTLWLETGQGPFTIGTTDISFSELTVADRGANPTASSTGAAINGSATTYMRSDGAPAINLDAAHGGTGQTSYAIGDLLYASSSSALSKLADVAVAHFLRSGGVGVAPLWSTLLLPNSATLNYVPYATGSNQWGESSALTFDGSTLTVAGLQQLTVSNSSTSSPPTGTSGLVISNTDTTNNNFAALVLAEVAGSAQTGCSVAALFTDHTGGSRDGDLVFYDYVANTTSEGGRFTGHKLTLVNPLEVAQGGTGLASWTQGDIPYYTSGASLSKLAKSTSSTRYISNAGSSNAPSWNQVDLSNGVTSNLPLTNGGMNASITADLGAIFYSTASAGALLASTATAGQALQSGASAAPSWVDPTRLNAGAVGTAVGGTGAGTGPTITFSSAGTDVDGAHELSVLTGSSPSASATVVTVTYGVAAANDSVVVIYPANSAAAVLLTTANKNVFVAGTSTTYVITSGSVALSATTTYLWNVIVRKV